MMSRGRASSIAVFISVQIKCCKIFLVSYCYMYLDEIVLCCAGIGLETCLKMNSKLSGSLPSFPGLFCIS